MCQMLFPSCMKAEPKKGILWGWGGGFGRRGKGEGMSETAEVSHLLLARALEGDSAPEPEGPTWASELGSSP